MFNRKGTWPMADETAADDVFLPAQRVRGRYGVSDMSLWRWLHDDEMGFPKPTVINRRRYWRVADLIAWERSRVGQSAAA